MKRTQNRIFTGPYEKTEGISGLRHFEGEDLSYQQRMKHQQEVMKEWMTEQKREHWMKDQQEKEEQHQYDEETKAIGRMRGMLEDESQAKRAAMMKAIQDEN